MSAVVILVVVVVVVAILVVIFFLILAVIHLVASNPCLYSADDLAGAATILTGHNPAGLCSGSREGTQIKARRSEEHN